MTTVFKGFSLLELLMGLVIVSILMTIAYPSYQHYLQRVHRQQAVLALMQLSDELARYHFKHHTYDGALLTDLNIPNVLEDHYEMTLDQQTQNTYLLSAKPLFTDTQCGTLSLNALHEKNISGEGSIIACW